LSYLPAELGFLETIELTDIRQRLLNAFDSDDPEGIVLQLSDQYRASGQGLLDLIDPTDSATRARGQIGFIIAQASMYFQAGHFGLYRTQLLSALTYAENMGYDEVVAQIQVALDNMPVTNEEQLTTDVSSSELALALSGVLSEEDCGSLSQLDLGDAIGLAFELLLAEGIEDPEAYLIELGILE
jgi:hypothetical protein